MLAATSALLERQPISTISITQLVKEAGVSRPTFYRHFSGVPDAARHAALMRLAAAYPSPPPVSSSDELAGANLHARMYARTVPILRHLELNRQYYRRVLEEAPTVDFIGSLVTLVASRLLPDPVDEIAERAGTGRDTVVAFVSAGISWFVIDWMRQEPPDDVEAAAARLASVSVALVRPQFQRPREAACLPDDNPSSSSP